MLVDEPVAAKRGRKPKEAAVSEPASNELIAMTLLKNYRPMGDFLIEEKDEDGNVTMREAGDAEGYGDNLKVRAGAVLHVPREEAKRMYKLKIAQRNDDF